MSILTLLRMLHFNEASDFIFRFNFALFIITVLNIESKLFLYSSMVFLLLLFWFGVFFVCLFVACFSEHCHLTTLECFHVCQCFNKLRFLLSLSPSSPCRVQQCGERTHRNTVGCCPLITLYRQCFFRLGIQIHFI